MTEKQINSAILNRKRIEFKFEQKLITFEPYYLIKNSEGNYIVYGRINASNKIEKFNILSLSNARISAQRKFSPIIPLFQNFN
jgi:hypothetical protein